MSDLTSTSEVPIQPEAVTTNGRKQPNPAKKKPGAGRQASRTLTLKKAIEERNREGFYLAVIKMVSGMGLTEAEWEPLKLEVIEQLAKKAAVHNKAANKLISQS